LHNLALFWVKNANFFAEFFGENISKIITSTPGHPEKYRNWSNLKTRCAWWSLRDALFMAGVFGTL
jgi:hypothetical protein